MSKYINIEPELIEYLIEWESNDDDARVFSGIVAYAITVEFNKGMLKKTDVPCKVTNDNSWMVKGHPGREDILIPCFTTYCKIAASLALWSKKYKSKIKAKELVKEEEEIMSNIKNNDILSSGMKELFIMTWEDTKKRTSGWAVKMH